MSEVNVNVNVNVVFFNEKRRRDMGVVAPCVGTELTSKGKGKGK